MGEGEEEADARMGKAMMTRLRVCGKWNWTDEANESRVERVTRRSTGFERGLHLRKIRKDILATGSSSLIFISIAQLTQLSLDSSSFQSLSLPLILPLLLAPAFKLVRVVTGGRIEVKVEVEMRVKPKECLERD